MTNLERSEQFTKWAVEHFIGIPADKLPGDEGDCIRKKVLEMLDAACAEAIDAENIPTWNFIDATVDRAVKEAVKQVVDGYNETKIVKDAVQAERKRCLDIFLRGDQQSIWHDVEQLGRDEAFEKAALIAEHWDGDRMDIGDAIRGKFGGQR